jgi:hypothetical protein
MARFCVYCGAQLHEEGAFCPACGKSKVGSVTESSGAAAHAVIAPDVKVTEPVIIKPESTPKWIKITPVALLVVVILAVIIYSLNRPAEPQRQIQSVPQSQPQPTPQPKAEAQPSATVVRPAWPNNRFPESPAMLPGRGAYVAHSSTGIPAFPTALSGYRSVRGGKDYYGRRYPYTGELSVHKHGWTALYPDFPVSGMSHCGIGVFMIRWRADIPNQLIKSSLGPYSKSLCDSDCGEEAKSASSFGYMHGTACDQPMFKFGADPAHPEVNGARIHYELKFWQAAP